MAASEPEVRPTLDEIEGVSATEEASADPSIRGNEATDPPRPAEEDVAVVLRSGVTRGTLEALVREHGATISAEHERERIYWVRIDAPAAERAVIADRIGAAPEVEILTPDPEGHFERWRMQKPPLRQAE